MAQPFDANRFETTGEPIPLAEQVRADGNTWWFFSSSRIGLLLSRSGVATTQLGWFDRTGKPLGLIAGPADCFDPKVICAFQSEHFTPSWLYPVAQPADRFLLSHEN